MQMTACQVSSKIELLKWINDVFKANITKIEQLSSGGLICQICEYVYPGSINLGKVNWRASNEIENIRNLKLLSDGLIKANCQKALDISGLAKGKYQDNLDIAQHLKQVYDKMTKRGEEYDPVSVRKSEEPMRVILQPIVRKNQVNKENKCQSQQSGVLVKRKASDLNKELKIWKKTKTNNKVGGLPVNLGQINEIMESQLEESEKVEKVRQLFG